MTPGAVAVRPARPGDLDDLVRLLEVLFSIEADFRPDAVRQRRGLALLLEDPERGCVLVAEDGGRAVGMATAQLVVSTAEGAASAGVEDVGVDAALRGRGVGRRLLAAAEAWARERGAARLQLRADRDNAPALAFYRRLGWSPTRLSAWRRPLR